LSYNIGGWNKTQKECWKTPNKYSLLREEWLTAKRICVNI